MSARESADATPGAASLRERLSSLFAELDADLQALSPRCAVSGRCCRFHEFDHTLFLSAVEAELLTAEAPPAVRPLDDGATCPWQDQAGRCTARDARPLGCRIYFCDPLYLPSAPGLSETYIARLKDLVRAHDLPWDYAPLHDHLRRARDEGRWNDPASGPGPRAGNP